MSTNGTRRRWICTYPILSSCATHSIVRHSTKIFISLIDPTGPFLYRSRRSLFLSQIAQILTYDSQIAQILTYDIMSYRNFSYHISDRAGPVYLAASHAEGACCHCGRVLTQIILTFPVQPCHCILNMVFYSASEYTHQRELIIAYIRLIADSR